MDASGRRGEAVYDVGTLLSVSWEGLVMVQGMWKLFGMFLTLAVIAAPMSRALSIRDVDDPPRFMDAERREYERMVREAAMDPLRVFDSVIKAHREAPTIKADIKLKIAILQEDQAGTGREVEATFIHRKGGHGKFTVGGYTFHLNPTELFAVHESNEGEYLRVGMNDYAYWSIVPRFGSFQRIPFPHLAMFWGASDRDDLFMELYSDTPALRPTAVIDRPDADRHVGILRFAGEHAVMEWWFNPMTFMVHRIEHRVTGGALVQRGAQMVSEYLIDVTLESKPAADEVIAFDPGDRRRIDSLIALDRSRAASGAESGANVRRVPTQWVGKPAPDFVLVTLDGERVDLRELRGRVVVVDFWATWCGPCVVLMPRLDDVTRWAREANLPVTVLAVNTFEIHDPERDTPEARHAVVREFWSDRDWSMKVPMDLDNAVARRYEVSGIPTSFVIGPDGIVVGHHVGGSRDYAETLKREISEALDGK